MAWLLNNISYILLTIILFSIYRQLRLGVSWVRIIKQILRGVVLGILLMVLFVFDWTHKHTSVPKELQQYVTEFGLLTGKDVSHLTMYWGNFEQFANGHQIIGLCEYILFERGNEIAIDRTFYNEADPIQIRWLIYHEMEHCSCYNYHNSKMLDDGCPATNMYPIISSTDCIIKHQEEYLMNMINNCK